MSTIRDSLQYQSSPYSVEEHFQEAHAILKACQHSHPDLLPFLLEPSNALVLGGMRAISPGISFGKHVREARSERFKRLLSQFGIAIFEEQFNYGTKPEEPVFLLIHTGALPAVGHQYRAVTDWWSKKPVAFDYLNYGDWYNYNVGLCVDKIYSGTFPSRWLANWYAGHDMSIGMLLGYPGVAICSYVNAQSVGESLGVKPDIDDISFDYPENMGVEVGYSVQSSDAASKQIAAHRKHWQDYFDAIYKTWTSFDYR